MQKGPFSAKQFACEMWDLPLPVPLVILRTRRRIYMKIYYCTPARRLQEDGSSCSGKTLKLLTTADNTTTTTTEIVAMDFPHGSN